jgi:hypothetical protein
MKFLAALLAALVCSVCCDPFTVKVSTKREYEVGENIDCSTIITNDHDKDYYLLSRNTPLEGLKSSIFSVTGSGKVLPYDGMLMKRGSPLREEYIFIGAKSSVSTSVDLSRVFSFVSAGSYSVQLKTELQYFNNKPENVSTQQVFSNVEVFTLKDSDKEPKVTEGQLIRQNSSRILGSPLRANAAISPVFRGSGDRDTATKVYLAAHDYLLPKCATSAKVGGNTNLYIQWFGRDDHRSTVEGNYLGIKEAMENYQFELYFNGPKCEPGVVAYTYHGATTLYLCDGYFRAPTQGSDSKIGTIVHEMSHAVAYTEDFKYGEQACQSLAKSDPLDAINNADNYEYFAEALL